MELRFLSWREVAWDRSLRREVRSVICSDDLPPSLEEEDAPCSRSFSCLLLFGNDCFNDDVDDVVMMIILLGCFQEDDAAESRW